MRASERGQASAEYVGLVTLVALVAVSAGTAVGLGEVSAAVASTVRTGICIVAGDVCRASDARAAGLAPCVVGDRSEGGGMVVSVGFVRFGDAEGLVVARRSDGSVVVTRSSERRGGLGAGFGVEASPVQLDVGVNGSVDFTVARGASWEFPDAAAAARFIAGDGDVPPTWRFGELGGELEGEASAAVRGLRIAGAEASVAGAAGVRIGRGQTTLYMRGQLDSGANVWAPGAHARVAGPSREVMIELTWERGTPRAIAFRTATRGVGSGQVVDTVARLDLRDPANRAAAGNVITGIVPSAPRLLALMLHTVRHGTVERAVYDVHDDSSDFALAVKLGAELGVDDEQVDVERRLVAASAWTQGSQERLREDCLA